MNQITLAGCVTGDTACFGLAFAKLSPDQPTLHEAINPLDAPEWINTGRTINVDAKEVGNFQTQVQTLREFLSWK